MSPYEMAGREKKIGRLLSALDAMLGRATTVDDVQQLTEAQSQDWLNRARCTGSKAPSDETIQLLAKRLKSRDEQRKVGGAA